jgi:membrane fusion protein (multidrug efflux system)
MKRTIFLLLSVIILASCGGKETKTTSTNKEEQLVALKKQRSDIDAQITAIEAETNKNTKKSETVAVTEVQPANFTAYVEVHAQVSGDQNVNATAQAPGIISSINVHPGQHVGRGQTLAILDAGAIEQQIKALEPQLALQKSLYERQQKLWAQNIGTEIQLMSSKAQYEAMSKQKAALQAQRGMYSIKSPISGVVDQVNLKVGDAVAPGQNGIHVVNTDKLKVLATLGENYLGKVHQGDMANLVFPDMGDTIKRKLSYVARAVDPVSRSFQVEVQIGSNKNLHPNMSCKMQIANYENKTALVVPVQVIQKTAGGDMVYVVDGKVAKSVIIKTGRNSNGMVEVLEGLAAGDKVITEGYQEVDNGEAVKIQ